MNIHEFIEQHPYINYCEAVIFPNGDIEYATPSHIYKLVSITGKTQEEINNEMPMKAVPLEYLVEYTKCISVWYNSFIYNDITDVQKVSLQLLVDHDIIANGIIGEYTNEKSKCEILDKFDKGEIKDFDFDNSPIFDNHDFLIVTKSE